MTAILEFTFKFLRGIFGFCGQSPSEVFVQKPPPPSPNKGPQNPSLERETELSSWIFLLRGIFLYSVQHVHSYISYSTVNSIAKFFVQKHLGSKCSLIAIFIFLLHLEINRNADPLKFSVLRPPSCFFLISSFLCWIATRHFVLLCALRILSPTIMLVFFIPKLLGKEGPQYCNISSDY